MLLSETYLETQTHELLMTFLVAMAPVIELRGAIPAGIASGLPPALACTAAIAGNLVPAPFIILLGRINIVFTAFWANNFLLFVIRKCNNFKKLSAA